MRRRLLCVLAPAVLAASLAATASAAPKKNFSMELGSTLTITGHTGAVQGEHVRATGKVVFSGRWGVGQWHVLTTTVTDSSGIYRIAFKPHHRGNLTLRIESPDHQSRQYILRIT